MKLLKFRESRVKLDVRRSSGARRKSKVEIPITVLIFSHQAERTITQALHSVLDQETDFPFEIILFDDASTDGTVQVALSELTSSRATWTLITPEKNFYSAGLNRMQTTLKFVKSEFVARLDGDDYWIGSGKLQRQYELLRANPELPVACTSWQIVDEVSKVIERPEIPGSGNFVPYSELLKANFICNSSVVFRAKAARGLPPSIQGLVVRDYAMWGYMTCGKDVLVDRTLGTSYRSHPTSIWMSKPLRERVLDEITSLEWLAENVRESELARLWKKRARDSYEWFQSNIDGQGKPAA